MVTKKYFQLEFLFGLIVLGVVALDQLLKYLIVYFNPNWDLWILRIHFIQNTGAGFGILQNQTIWLGLISLIVTLAVIIGYKRIPREKFPQILFALFLGGTIGNLIDRFLRKFVVDFIDFSFWPAFNLADAVITLSVIGLMWYFWKK